MLESPLDSEDIKPVNPKGNQPYLFIHWKDWYWSSNTLATWCKEPTHWKRPSCWERLKGKEEGSRGWDGEITSPTQQTWIWANSRKQWKTGKPGVLQSTGSQRVGHSLATGNNSASSSCFTSVDLGCTYHMRNNVLLQCHSKQLLESCFAGWRWKRRVKSWFKTQHSKNEDYGIWSHLVPSQVACLTLTNHKSNE